MTAAPHLMDLTLTELSRKVQSGEATPSEVISACFERIELLQPKLNAFTVLCKEQAVKEAQQQTEKLKAGEKLGPLAGVPLAVKDLEDVEGLPTSFGAIPFKDKIAAEDSPQVARLRKAGAIVVGKTNVPAFGSTIMSKNIAYGATRSPWSLDLTPGGSSGGSSCVAAARISPLVTAADGGGSIRNPACFTGCFGLKPTRGVVPMTEGYSFEMDRFVHCVSFGPITRSVEDAALFMDIVAGYHPSDPMSIPRPVPSYQAAMRNNSGKLKVLYTADLGFVSYVDPKILEHSRKSAEVFAQSMGHDVTFKDKGEAEGMLPDLYGAWGIAMGAQEREMVLPHLKEGDSKNMERGILGGWEGLKDLKVSSLANIYRDVWRLNRAIDRLFKDYDVVITPAMPVPPFGAKGPVPVKEFDFPLHVVGFLSPFNLSGHPACVIRFKDDPMHNDAPLGAIQIVGERFRDDLVLEMAYKYEQAVQPFTQWPSVEKLSSAESKL